jgi:peptidoglycan/LPS O-acetylase OafA/YrhL
MAPEQTSAPTRRRLRQLEAARGFAAVYVFAHHYRSLTGLQLRLLLSFSTVAVMVFFLLSGFVIYLSSGVDQDRFELRSYARKRAARILPPYLVALVLAYLVHRFALAADGASVPINVDGLIRNMLFLVESGRVHGVNGFHGNPPLWSLSYEAWFYVFFAAIVCWFGPQFHRLRRCALAVSAIGFVTVWLVPNPVSQYAVLFVIWWAGAELAREWSTTGTVTLWGQRYALGCIAIVGALTGGRLALVHVAGGTAYPRTHSVELLIAAVVIVAVVTWKRFGMIGFDRTIGLFLVFGPISYGVYLFHYPLIRLALAVGGSGSKPVVALWAIPAVFAFSWVFDLQLHRLVLRWTRRRQPA